MEVANDDILYIAHFRGRSFQENHSSLEDPKAPYSAYAYLKVDQERFYVTFGECHCVYVYTLMEEKSKKSIDFVKIGKVKNLVNLISHVG